MVQLQLANITLILGAKRIFENLNWEIQDGQKIGLIGANGAGKSSLFKMIEGEYSPELGGSITRARLITTGYLSQSPELDFTLTALDAALAGNPRVAEVHTELESVENSLGDPEIYGNERRLQQALELQHKLVEEYHVLGADTYPARVRGLLLGLGLAQSELTKPLSVLSGGQKKLVGLARLLLVRPDILLLDEPDNHLDLPGKMFLEKLIREYEGTVVLISHDRYLLDAAVTHIAELEDGKLTLFSGNYTEFVLDKEERLARQEELYQIQQRGLTRMEMAIKRYKIWVQFSDKFATRIHAMEVRMARVDKIDRPILDRKRMDMRLGGWRGSNKVLELAEVSAIPGMNKTVGVIFHKTGKNNAEVGSRAGFQPIFSLSMGNLRH